MKIIANAPMWFLLLGHTACGELDLHECYLRVRCASRIVGIAPP